MWMFSSRRVRASSEMEFWQVKLNTLLHSSREKRAHMLSYSERKAPSIPFA